MPCQSCHRRESIPLDAGYVVYQPIKTVGLQGGKLLCVIALVSSLFVISLINLTCLIWVMYQLDWPIFDGNTLRIDGEIRFSKLVRSNHSIYTTEIIDDDRIDISANKPIDLNGHRNSILFDENRLFFHTDRFHLKNKTLIHLKNLHSFQFDSRLKTRIHLDRFSSKHIHNHRLNLTAKKQLTISRTNQAFFSAQNIILQANRHNHRSVLRFQTPSSNVHSNGFHMKSDVIYLDLPQFPLLGKNHRSELLIDRICICEKTFLFHRISAYESCPSC